MPPSDAPSTKTIHEVYLYLVGRCLAIRQEHIDIAQTPYNVIKYNPLGSASADFVNPNLDVAYWESWIAVDDSHAVVLEIPKITGRYYTVQVMDAWGEVLANINERTFPEHPYGLVAFVNRGTHPSVPDGALRIDVPFNKVKVLGRVELQDTPEEAVALQHRFTLTVPDGIVIDPAPDLPMFNQPQLPDVWIFEKALTILDSYPDSMPGTAELRPLVEDVARFALSGPEARQYLQQVIDTQLKPYFFGPLMDSRPSRNGWTIYDHVGRFGDNYEMRTLCNFGGIWANVPEEALYYIVHHDVSGQLLSGSNHYALRFDADALPDVACSAFWSVTCLRMPDYRAVPNDLNRFSINNFTGAELAADGSMTLHLAPELPDGVPANNWLPTPRDTETTFMFRLYEATRTALDETWFVPGLERMND